MDIDIIQKFGNEFMIFASICVLVVYLVNSLLLLQTKPIDKAGFADFDKEVENLVQALKTIGRR